MQEAVGIQNHLTAMEQIMSKTAVAMPAQRHQALGVQLTALTKVMRGLAAATRMRRPLALSQKGKVQSQRTCLAYPISS